MRVTRPRRMGRHLVTMGGPKHETSINCAPSPWTASVSADEQRDGNSLPCPGFDYILRVQLWHIRIEKEQGRIKMARMWNVLHWVEFEFWKWDFGRRSSKLRFKSPLRHLRVVSGLQRRVTVISNHPSPLPQLCYAYLLSGKTWSSSDSVSSAVEALAEVELHIPQSQAHPHAAAVVYAIKSLRLIPSSRASLWILISMIRALPRYLRLEPRYSPSAAPRATQILKLMSRSYFWRNRMRRSGSNPAHKFIRLRVPGMLRDSQRDAQSRTSSHHQLNQCLLQVRPRSIGALLRKACAGSMKKSRTNNRLLDQALTLR